MQRMSSVPILRITVNVPIGTMFNTNAKFDVDAKFEQTLISNMS